MAFVGALRENRVPLNSSRMLSPQQLGSLSAHPPCEFWVEIGVSDSNAAMPFLAHDVSEHREGNAVCYPR